jgi:hypothetical protein
MPAQESSASYQAMVIPADGTKPVRVVGYARQSDLLSLLYREIGCEHVDATPELSSRLGPFVLWLDDVGLLMQPVVHNDRAIALCRAVGYDVADLAGTAVVTGGVGDEGDTLTLPPVFRDWLLHAFRQVPTGPGSGDPTEEGEQSATDARRDGHRPARGSGRLGGRSATHAPQDATNSYGAGGAQRRHCHGRPGPATGASSADGPTPM